jgi:EmrB/QacA subfamily drug resistance transporter
MNPVSLSFATSERRRWLALVVVCFAQLMIVLDTTIVNVALPAIQRDLHFTQGNLTWVVNAFLVTFGSFLLLAGRLGDLLGRRRVFLTGVVVFTVASALCGLAPSQGLLIAGRLIQGVGAALSASAILAIIVTEFPQPSDRARAMSAYVFVAVAGGSLGLLAGGALTQALNWHWIFFVNLPIGIATIAFARALIPADKGIGLEHGVDWLGSILVTCSLMIAVYAIVQATSHGWASSQVLGFGALAIALMGAFLVLEARIEYPIMPLRILRLRSLIGASAVRGFLVTGMYSTFFLGTLYLEHVLHYSALRTGLAFLPWTVTVGILSLGVTARLVDHFGSMRVLVAGMVTVIIGLALLCTAEVHTSFFPTIFFAYFAIGLGIGSSFMPLLTRAMADVPAADAGLGSGITNVSQQVAGALGLAVLGTIATNHSKALEAQGHTLASSLVGGYHLAFAIGAASIVIGIVTALAVLGTRAPSGLPSGDVGQHVVPEDGEPDPDRDRPHQNPSRPAIVFGYRFGRGVRRGDTVVAGSEGRHEPVVEGEWFAYRAPALREEQLDVVIDPAAHATGEHDRSEQADDLLRHVAGPQALNHRIRGDLVQMHVSEAVLNKVRDTGSDREARDRVYED